MPRALSAKRFRDFDARRICIIKPSALGDVVQSMPLLGALRHRFPKAEISWVINRELSDLLIGHPQLTEIIPFDRHGSIRDAFRLLRTLHQRDFDLVFDLQGLLRTGLMTFATRAGVRVGLETAREGANLACNYVLPETGRDVPAYARYWRVAEMFGWGHLPRTLDFPQTAADLSWVSACLKGLPRPILAIHPGARWATKRWPAERFAEVARRAVKSLAGTVLVVGSRSEQSLGAEIVASVEQGGGRAVNLAGETNLKQLAGVLQSVDLLLSNDSGPMHLAAELGTPVVGVFTCTSPVLSGPAGKHHELVATTVSCAAGYHKTCPHRGTDELACLREISVERVWAAVARASRRRAAA